MDAADAQHPSGDVHLNQVALLHQGDGPALGGLGGDVALLAGIALVSAALVFAGNLAANLIYGLVDPRMRPVRRQKEVADD